VLRNIIHVSTSSVREKPEPCSLRGAPHFRCFATTAPEVPSITVARFGTPKRRKIFYNPKSISRKENKYRSLFLSSSSTPLALPCRRTCPRLWSEAQERKDYGKNFSRREEKAQGHRQWRDRIAHTWRSSYPIFWKLPLSPLLHSPTAILIGAPTLRSTPYCVSASPAAVTATLPRLFPRQFPRILTYGNVDKSDDEE